MKITSNVISIFILWSFNLPANCQENKFILTDTCKSIHNIVKPSETEFFFNNTWEDIHSKLTDGCWYINYDTNDYPVFIKFNVIEGKLEGEWLEFDVNGVMKRLVKYSNGQLEGFGGYYSSKGNLWKILEYNDGLLIRELLLNEDGLIFGVIDYYGKKPGLNKFAKPRKIDKKYEVLIHSK